MEPLRIAEPTDIRTRQIEDFLRQTGKSENTQTMYRSQLRRFVEWSGKAWIDVTATDIGRYRKELKQQGLKPASINHAINTLKSFYRWLQRSSGYLEGKPLPTDAIELERTPEPAPDHLEPEQMERIWEVLAQDGRTRVRDRALISILSHGLRASEASSLNVEHWGGRILVVHRSKGQNVSKVPLDKAAKGYLNAYLDWRRSEGGVFTPEPESPLFVCHNHSSVKGVGDRLSYKGIYEVVKALGVATGISDLNPHRFRHTFGTQSVKLGVDPMFGKELMGIKSDKVFQRYTKGVFQDAAVNAYLEAIGEE